MSGSGDEDWEEEAAFWETPDWVEFGRRIERAVPASQIVNVRGTRKKAPVDLGPLLTAEVTHVNLEGAIADLAPLLSLPNLEQLAIDNPPAGTDLSVLASLTSLERLSVYVWDRSVARQLASLDLSRLKHLGSLTLANHSGLMSMRMAWLPSLTELRAADIDFVAYEEDFDVLSRLDLRHLKELRFIAPARNWWDRFEAAGLANGPVWPAACLGPDRGPIQKIGSGAKAFQLTIDAAALGDTTTDALDEFWDRLESLPPHVRALIEVDPDSDHIYLYARTRKTLEAVLRLFPKQADDEGSSPLL